MTSKVATGFIAPDNGPWLQSDVNVCEDGSWWWWNGQTGAWEQIRPPLPVALPESKEADR